MRRLIIIGVCVGLWATGFATAQDDLLTIAFGESLEGDLTNERYRETYIFAGRADEIISISMQALDGDLDPLMTLVGADGNVVAHSDDDGDGKDAFIDNLRLPADGDYFLIATRFGHEHGSTTGAYQLTLQRIGATTAPGATLQFGDSIFGSITPDMPQVTYTFYAPRGTVINLTMNRTSGNLDPFIDVANERGQIVISGDDDPTIQGTLNAGIRNFTVPQTGFYVVVATRYGRNAGTSTGSFILSLEEISQTARGFSPANAILLDYGDSVSGSIGAETPQRFYTFSGRRGDVITVDMQRTFGNLHTTVLLLDDQVQEVARAGDRFSYTQAQIVNFTLPQDGTYYIMATRDGFADGTTAGDFDLTLEGREGISNGAFLEIVYGAEIVGVISDTQLSESFVFLAEAGDVVSITVSATTGDLAPLVTLYLGNKQIAFADSANGAQVATIQRFNIAEAGVYRIEASRVGRATGQTSGGYSLALDAE